MREGVVDGMTDPRSLHVCVAGHIAGEDVRRFLHDATVQVPGGYFGAPLMGVLIGALLEKGCKVTGVTTDAELPPDNPDVVLEGPNFRFIVVPCRRRAWRPNGRHLGRAVDVFALERRRLRQAIAGADADIIHAHWSYEFALAAIGHRAPHLITCHDSPRAVLRHMRNVYRSIRYLMARRVFKIGKRFTAVSSYLADEVAPHLARPAVVVPNPVAPQALALGRQRSLGTTRRIAMVCNGWGPLKNPQPAMAAYAVWRADNPQAEMHLFGVGFERRGPAAAWASEQGISDGMVFHGVRGHADLLTELSGMDALVHPALEESFGVVLAEAMALGLPVVAGRRSGAVPWVLGAETESAEAVAGALVDVQSERDLRRGFAEVFGPRYEEFSARGLERARRFFSADAVASAYLGLYAECLAGAGGARALKTNLG
ncbi:MAG: glycosyltransferase [Burkholderiales bacterium]|uniref:glycosyltransferase family 4 protein n=1 Tax=Roseateles sp. TaxID=1971397 RepID=UPI000FB781F5|nr:MAG: glycosyltransferase [Burkholderiales bacterium]